MRVVDCVDWIDCVVLCCVIWSENWNWMDMSRVRVITTRMGWSSKQNQIEDEETKTKERETQRWEAMHCSRKKRERSKG